MGGYRISASVEMRAFQHSTVAGGGRSLPCSCTPLALPIACSPAPLSSLRAVVSDESSNEDGGDWPGSEGWHGGCGEMSGGVEIAFYFHVACASPPSLCAGVAPRDKQINRHEKSQAKTHGKPTNTKTHRF